MTDSPRKGASVRPSGWRFVTALRSVASLLCALTAGACGGPAAPSSPAAATPPAATALSDAPATPSATPSPGAAVDERTYTFRLGSTALIAARMDTSWTDETRYHAGDLRMIRFVRPAVSASGPPRATIMMTPLWPVPPQARVDSATEVRAYVRSQARQMEAGAVEQTLQVTEAVHGEFSFTYFTATDAKPGAGEFARATQGMLVARGIPLSVTILHDELETRDQVLDRLAGWNVFGVATRAVPRANLAPGVLDTACKRGDGLACGLAVEVHRDAGDDQSLGWATRGCDGGSAFACGTLGSYYAEGNGVAQDDARARQILQKGCDAHGDLACLNLASLAARGNENPDSNPAIVALADKACGFGGDKRGVCRLPVAGRVAQAEYRAAVLAACDRRQARECRALGWDFETGYGGAIDVDRARDAYARGCELGDLWACFREGLLASSLARQKTLYTAACERGSGPSCYALAQPAFGPTDQQRAALWRQACNSGIEDACWAFATTLGD